MYYVGAIPCYSSDELIHFGVKGMKWGHRRFQNEDGTFNTAGKARYFQTADGKIKKRGLIDRSIRQGEARLTKKNGKARSLIGATVRSYASHTVKSIGEQAAVGALGVGAMVAVGNLTGNMKAVAAIKAGTAAASAILGTRRLISYYADQAGVVAGYAKRKKEKYDARLATAN